MWHEMLSDYLSSVETVIQSLGNCHIEKYEEGILSANRANLRVRVRFLKGQLLEINEAIVIDSNELHQLAYRYHFQDRNNHLIFRFDNTPHYSGY